MPKECLFIFRCGNLVSSPPARQLAENSKIGHSSANPFAPQASVRNLRLVLRGALPKGWKTNLACPSGASSERASVRASGLIGWSVSWSSVFFLLCRQTHALGRVERSGGRLRACVLQAWSVDGADWRPSRWLVLHCSVLSDL